MPWRLWLAAAQPRRLLALGLAGIALGAALLGAGAGFLEAGLVPFDARPFYTAEDITAVRDSVPAVTLRGYVRSALTLDLLFPPVYAGLLGAALVLASGVREATPPVSLARCAWAPIAALALDYAENLLVSAALSVPYTHAAAVPLARSAGFATAGKWLAVGVALVVPVILLAARRWRR